MIIINFMVTALSLNWVYCVIYDTLCAVNRSIMSTAWQPGLLNAIMRFHKCKDILARRVGGYLSLKGPVQ